MLNNYRQIIAGMKSTPWLITEDSLQVICDIVNRHIAGETLTAEEIKFHVESAENGERENPRIQIDGGVGLISVYGPMFPKANLMTEISGATSLETLRNDISMLARDDSVKQIVLDMDTPGGSHMGTPETARAIREARDVKPVYAIANGLSASGGLWLGSQATKFYSTESGRVGSLGVYHIVEDNSEADRKEGTKVSFIHAGKYKVAGNPHEPLTEEARAYIQEGVDEIYGDFIDAVAEGRGISTEYVKENFGDAKMHSPTKASEINMIDGILSLDDLLGGLVQENATEMLPVTTLGRAVARASAGSEASVAVDNKPSFLDRIKGGKKLAQLTTDDMEKAHQDTPNPDDTRTPARAEGDEGGDGGSRRDVPALDQQIATLFGLPADTPQTELVSHIKKIQAEVAPIREAVKEVEDQRSFAAMFPVEAARMQELDQKDKAANAKEFAARYQKFVGTDEKPSDIGFSAKTLNVLEEAHLAFANGQGSVEHLVTLVDSIASSGLVSYSEQGSSRFVERVDASATNDGGKLFSQCVAEVMEQDKLDYGPAVKIATQRYPEEFAAYRETVNRGGDDN